MADMGTTPAEVIVLAEENGVDMVDLKLVDLPGAMRHVTVPVGRLTEVLFEKGAVFDGSSIRGFHADGGELALLADPATAAVDPVPEIPTLSLLCDVCDPSTGAHHPRDSRWVARKAERYLRDSGIADSSRWRAAPQFFVFDAEPTDVRGVERSTSPPVDTTTDIRSETAIKLAGFGVAVERHRHGEDAAGHGEIAVEADSLTGAADAVLVCKYLLKGTARDYGRAATFMPKPTAGDASAGMPTRQSLWEGGRNLFDGGGGVSELAAHYVGGLFAHAPALMAFCASTTNSYRMLAPDGVAPVASAGTAGGQVVFRNADGACNPYLAFAAMLMAGIDGVLNGTDPGEPGRLPASLGEALDALEAGHDFLTMGDVFTDDIIGAWLEHKRTNEVAELKRRPHPYELALYFDA